MNLSAIWAAIAQPWAAKDPSSPFPSGSDKRDETTTRLYTLFDYLNAFEGRSRTDEWLAGDIHLWPVTKHLCVSLVLKFANDPAGFDRAIAVSHRQFSDRRKNGRRFDARTAAGLLSANGGDSAPFLFVGNRTTFKELGGLAVQLNYDYLRTALEVLGHGSSSLLAGISNDQIAATPSLLAHESMANASEYLALNYSTERPLDLMSGAHDLAGFLTDLLGVRSPDRLLSHLNLYASRVADAAAAWEITLRSRQVRSSFCYNYTNPVGWGLAIASSRLGLQCHEIQHGIQGAMHGAYQWTKVPERGWTSVPRGRLVWSAVEGGLADDVSTVRMVGPSSLQTMAMLVRADGASRLAQAKQRLLAQAEPVWRDMAPDGRRRVLFLSQGKADLDILRRLVSENEHRYFYRLHPSQDEFPANPDLAVLLSSVRAQASTRLPLPMIMAGADVILCHSSAGFIEGRYFGLPTVFLDDYAHTIQGSYGREDLIASSPENCRADLAGVTIGTGTAMPLDNLMATIETLPDIGEIAAGLAGNI